MNEVVYISEWIKRYRSELYHYGVKGMKWGVRRTRAELDRANGPRVIGAHKETLKRKIPIGKQEELRYSKRKTEEYLLNPNHPKGGSKAKYFQDVLGYRQTDSKLFHKRVTDSIINRKPDKTTVTEYGTKHSYNTKLLGKNHRTANVTVSIQVDNLRKTYKIVSVVPRKKDKP